MVKKALRATSGVKVKTNLGEKKANPNQDRLPYESPRKIKNCLNCTKPVEECKGNCYGRL
jgi:hypothetical protein